MKPIVGIGELLWDIFPDGQKVAGGAPFNFAFHCQQLGHNAVIVSRVGNDELGRELREEVRRLGLSDEYIQTDYNHPTGTVRVTLDAHGQPSYELIENVAWDYIEWDEKLKKLAESCETVCYGTLGQRSERSRETVRRFVKATPSLAIFDVNVRPSVNDTFQLVEESSQRCTWFKASCDDIVQLHQFAHIQVCENQRSSLSVFFDPGTDQRKLGILTLGENGCEVIDWQRNYRERRVDANVVDTVGAGDSFLAAFLCFHLEGQTLKRTMRFAMHYAARVCESPGATPRIDRVEVELRFIDDPWMRGES